MKTEIIKTNKPFSHKIKITPAKGRKNKDAFTIPVVDSKDSRKEADAMIKAENIRKGSRFMRTKFSVIGKPFN